MRSQNEARLLDGVLGALAVPMRQVGDRTEYGWQVQVIAMTGSIPVLHVTGLTMASAWEESMLRLWKAGCRVKTEYDKPEDPVSVDSTMLITVLHPDLEPAIHRAFPGGLGDLEEYRLEVVEGIKDKWIRDPENSDDTRWEYTYHRRLAAYECYTPLRSESCLVDLEEIDQLEAIVQRLAKTPYSRRAQAVTWQPWTDLMVDSPPCLQEVWCRILPDDQDVWRLNMNVRFRSRDAYDAAFMNIWAFVALQESLAARIAEVAGREVLLGRYCDLSDSYHIYGRRLEHFKNGFLKGIEERSFEDRTWTREFAEPFFEERRAELREKGLLK